MGSIKAEPAKKEDKSVEVKATPTTRKVNTQEAAKTKPSQIAKKTSQSVSEPGKAAIKQVVTGRLLTFSFYNESVRKVITKKVVKVVPKKTTQGFFSFKIHFTATTSENASEASSKSTTPRTGSNNQ